VKALETEGTVWHYFFGQDAGLTKGGHGAVGLIDSLDYYIL
jgi:hypothetical protein